MPPERKEKQPTTKKKVKAKKPKPVKEKTPKPGFHVKSLISNKPVLIGGALMIVVILVLVFSGGGRCSSVEECRELAHEAIEQNDYEAAVGILEDAASLVPDEQHPGYADIWCQRGELLMELGRVDQKVIGVTTSVLPFFSTYCPVYLKGQVSFTMKTGGAITIGV